MTAKKGATKARVPKKYCRVHYRRLLRVDGNFPVQSLSNRIGAALATEGEDGTLIGNDVRHRLCDVPGQAEFRRVLNNTHVHPEYVFGVTCLFAPGQMQALLLLSSEAEPHSDLAKALAAWEVRERRAPTGHEYVTGMTYWLAIGDHFYQIQHVTLQAKAMEEYLTWLLRDKAGVIKETQHVMLRTEFDRKQFGDDVTGIKIGGVVPRTSHGATAEAVEIEVEEHQTLVEKRRPGFAQAKGIVQLLFGELAADKIIDSLPDDADLEVEVDIGYRAKRRKLRKAFMRDLEEGLRNLDDGEIQVVGPRGVVKGEDARLSMDIPVKRISVTSSLLDPAHALEQMLEVHKRFIADEMIDV